MRKYKSIKEKIKVTAIEVRPNDEIEIFGLWKRVTKVNLLEKTNQIVIYVEFIDMRVTYKSWYVFLCNAKDQFEVLR